MGRKAIQDQAMTNAERQRRYRQMQKSKSRVDNIKSTDSESPVSDETKDKNVAELVDYCMELENELEDSEKRYNNFVNRINYLLRGTAESFNFRVEFEDNEVVFKRAIRDYVEDGSRLDTYIERIYFKELLNGDFISHKKSLSDEYAA